MAVERSQDAQKLVLSRHGWLIPAKRFCIALPLVEEAGAQPVAQLDAASAAASGVQHCVPSAFLPLHPNAHHPSLALHLEEKFLAGDDRDGLVAWGLDGPLTRGLQVEGAFLVGHEGNLPLLSMASITSR
jgi:hypothetical protein